MFVLKSYYRHIDNRSRTPARLSQSRFGGKNATFGVILLRLFSRMTQWKKQVHETILVLSFCEQKGASLMSFKKNNCADFVSHKIQNEVSQGIYTVTFSLKNFYHLDCHSTYGIIIFAGNNAE